MAGEAAAEPVDVLVVEEDSGNVLMITEAFDQSSIPTRLHVVGNGEEAISFLRAAAGHAGAPGRA